MTKNEVKEKILSHIEDYSEYPESQEEVKILKIMESVLNEVFVPNSIPYSYKLMNFVDLMACFENKNNKEFVKAKFAAVFRAFPIENVVEKTLVALMKNGNFTISELGDFFSITTTRTTTLYELAKIINREKLDFFNNHYSLLTGIFNI